ncbi:MAG: hypothetical protein K0U79_02860 [Gammaproteobacteria bacterium]|nr:hypothetical protein [Gammaproteobacteria bacterium]
MARQFKNAWAVALCALAMLSGCGAANTVTKPATAPEDRFVPVNFTLDAGEYLTLQQAEVANHLSNAVVQSDRFVRVERGVMRWPFTLQMKYGAENEMTTAEFAGLMVSAASLFVIPSKTTETHRLTVDLFVGSTLARTFTYDEELTLTTVIFKQHGSDRKACVDRLLDRFYEDLEAADLIPHVRDFAPTDAEKTELGV